MRKIEKAVVAVALLSVLCGLLGCGKAPNYTVEDIRSVSISCGHMDYSHSYAFSLRKAESGWLLDADYAADTEHPHTEYEACPVAEEDVRELLHIVREQEVIEKLRQYKKPMCKVQVLDETTYYSSVLFADGAQMAAGTCVSGDLESCFYRLAEKYAPTVPETYDTESMSDKEESF